ncbi:cupredoxin family copper-binding protein [Nostocaceae cyanobacterium CENA369]|uniref:Cupredoxin family copper-binding protein n=1 Tax=Dendronalium phyllosphericum CENA369 TaxID=1725256 RepID=A0A8J7LL56_9NOST|nr:cupredoxin family copper-binding protein [Dendronalium phyllosphericum]MBH8578164.1 cupredoxin family copper-binding protein [Dendronalium phyllosphericum CENA369]
MKYISYFFIAIASALLVILLSLSSCSPNPKTTSQPPQTRQQTADTTVKIRNFKFEPANLAIAVGKTVQFINVDEEPHTATAMDGTFNSKALDTNQTWNYTATKPGTYPYICSVHPFMKGTLTVTNKKN